MPEITWLHCVYCRCAFRPKSIKHIFCSAKCRQRHAAEQAREHYTPTTDTTPRECKQCGNEFVPTRDWQEFCSTDCRKSFHRDQYKEAMSSYRQR